MMSADPPVYGFVDLSNVYLGRIQAAMRHGEDPAAVRLEAESFARLVRAGRSTFGLTTVANAEVPEAVIERFRRIGDVILRETGRRTGTEQANDEALQVRMYETMHAHPRSVVVLATGDGAGSIHGHGFIPALQAARQHGCGVEVLSWADNANGRLRTWVAKVGGSFVELDDYYFSITFEEAGRRVQPVNLTRRPTSIPGPRGQADG